MDRPLNTAPREQRRDEILTAARAVFCAKGFDPATVAEIAARCGIVEGTVYRYFPSKHALLVAVLEQWYRPMFAQYAQDLAGIRDARGRLRMLIWRHLRTIHEAPDLCRLMFAEARRAPESPDEPASELRQLNRRYTRFLIEVLEDGIQRGEFRPGIPGPLFRDLVFGGIEHHCWRYLSGQGELDIDAAADQITEIFCDGAAPAEPLSALQAQTDRLAALIDHMEHSH